MQRFLRNVNFITLWSRKNLSHRRGVTSVLLHQTVTSLSCQQTIPKALRPLSISASFLQAVCASSTFFCLPPRETGEDSVHVISNPPRMD